jgi:adenosine deaminase
MEASPITKEIAVAAPKVLLHEHLDGGVRPATVLELAQANGYPGLPTYDLAELEKDFVVDSPGADLVQYLQGFAHTTAVMQTTEELHRVAREGVVDLARDGVVYAEIRFAPEQHLTKGLTMHQVVEAVVEGFRQGEVQSKEEGHPIVARAILSAMRQAHHSNEVAKVAIDFRDAGVCAFDIAGPEDGFPPTQHLEAFDMIRQANFHLTIHAGEAFGPPSIWEAIQICGTERLGHGIHIFDDIEFKDGEYHLGRLAQYIRDRRIPLEVCPTSNIHTGVAPSIKEHPINILRQLNFRVTVNTDNRLMSGISLSDEFYKCSQAFGWTVRDMERLTIDAMKSAFFPYEDRLNIIWKVIKPGYAALNL